MTDSLERLAKTAGLNSRAAARWEELSAEVIATRLGGRPTAIDKDLQKESVAVKGHALSIAYRGWIAENSMLVGQPITAIKLFDALIADADGLPQGPYQIDPLVTLLRFRARAMRTTGDPKLSIEGAVELASMPNLSHPAFSLAAARTAEHFAAVDTAEHWYERVLADTANAENEHYRVRATVEETPAYYREVARRDLDRLRRRPDALQSAETLAQALADAIDARDDNTLMRLASPTHFSVAIGCHAAYVDVQATVESICQSLRTCLAGPFKLISRGEHRQLSLGIADGGNPLRYASLILRKHARGWDWTGIHVLDAGFWLSDFPAAPIETNQPLSIRIRGPWQSGRKFMAGGFRNPWHGFVSGTTLDPVSLAIRSCGSECGFGMRGFYYNEALSHNGVSAFAIDFSSYEQCVPFSDRANLWPVLAPADGLVVGTWPFELNGSDSRANAVELIHPMGTPTCRYLSRYLHLAGTPAIPVSAGMFVRGGSVLGFMDDTGNSAMPHLHFSMHDQSAGPHPDLVTSSVSAPIMYGPSVRPTPMAGQSLNDVDDGRCIDSHNSGVRPRVTVAPGP